MRSGCGRLFRMRNNHPRWEIALGLFGPLGAGLALAIPEAQLLGIAICAISAFVTSWLYKEDFRSAIFWLFRRRIHLPFRMLYVAPDTLLAALIVLIGIGVPIYRLYPLIAQTAISYGHYLLAENSSDQRQGGVFQNITVAPIGGPHTIENAIRVIGGGNNKFDCVHIDHAINGLTIDQSKSNSFKDLHIGDNRNCTDQK